MVNRDAPLLRRFLDAPFTYPDVGATALARHDEPVGYHHVQSSEVIGHGSAEFSTASEALMSWQMHRRAGLHVTASSPRAEPDAVLVMRLGVGSLGLVVPCRVVYVVNDKRRTGFAYGTLPGHPESGEEAFVVELLDDQRVQLQITAFSRPARWFSKFGGPASRRAQAMFTDRYVHALRGR